MMNDRIENLILSALFDNEEYTRKVLPFIQPEYFEDKAERVLFEHIKKYIDEYNNLPTKEAVVITLSDDPTLNETQYQEVSEKITNLKYDSKLEDQWLIDQTEEFCKDRALYNALMDSVKIAQGEGNVSQGQIPQIMSDALAVSFDPHVGHDYLEDYEIRYDEYHKEKAKYEFDLEYFNKITGGGIEKKTLNVILAGTNVGKTLMMCHFAGSHLMQGYNILYVTLEIEEEKIAGRIDANKLNISMDQLETIPKALFLKKIKRVQEKTKGKLIIKEYPTSMATVTHLRHLLNELKLKKNFVPDILYVDYINIMASSRHKYDGNSFGYVKAIAEELRGLASEQELPIFTATQTNRKGFSSSDVSLEDTAESFGLPQTADFMVGAMTSETFAELGQLSIKQLKNRYRDKNKNKKFVIGVDYNKMRLYDVEQSAQTLVDDGQDDTPGFDKTDFGKGMKAERNDGMGRESRNTGEINTTKLKEKRTGKGRFSGIDMD